MPLWVHELFHFFTSLIVGAIAYWEYGNLGLVAVAFFAGFLIDIDHIFDYSYYLITDFRNLNERRRIDLILDFFRPEYYIPRIRKVFILLHGWEYLLVISLLINAFWEGTPGLKFALIASYFFHLLFDQILCSGNLLSYFFFFRFFNKFSLEAFHKRIGGL